AGARWWWRRSTRTPRCWRTGACATSSGARSAGTTCAPTTAIRPSRRSTRPHDAPQAPLRAPARAVSAAAARDVAEHEVQQLVDEVPLDGHPADQQAVEDRAPQRIRQHLDVRIRRNLARGLCAPQDVDGV